MSSVRLRVDLRRLPWIRRLTADYAHNFSNVAHFFSGDPSSREAWRVAIASVQSHQRRRTEIVELLFEQQRRFEAPPAAIAACERLRDPSTIAIVTGQQAGLFGGPLYTLLKALTAIRLAERVTRDYQVAAVPIFWIDAEDHDWEEVRSCHVLDADLKVRSVELPAVEETSKPPVASVKLTAFVDTTLRELGALLPPTEFTEPLLTKLRQAYQPGVGMAVAFGRLLETVFGTHGLVVFDGSDKAAKPLVADLFVRELQMPCRTAELAAAAGNELAECGYHTQAATHADAVALFHLDEGRRPIRWRGGEFVVGETEQSSASLLAEAIAHPANFSPNVLLRPIVQDTLLPTVCYVAGPNELAYLAQLRGVYEHFGVPMPLVYPRVMATLLDTAAARFLAKYEVPLEDLQARDESVLNHLIESRLPPTVEQTMKEAARAVKQSLTGVIAAVGSLDPTLEGAASSTLGRMEKELGTLHNKIIHAAKQRDETLRRQFAKTQAQAFPDGHPQERAIGFVYFLNRYGPEMIQRLTAELPIDMGHHWVLAF